MDTHEIRKAGIENAPKESLSYDKIIKGTLAQSAEMTVRFINGLFDDHIPLDAPVVWLDKETVNDKHTAFVADFYPKIDGKMYSIEVEHDDNGDMAVRVFKYAIGGAMLHSMTATDADLNITIPQPAVVFLRNTANTPRSITWNIDFFDGQKVKLIVPTILLSELSIKEIAGRNLFPVGQFYLRKFEPLTKKNEKAFNGAMTELVTELRKEMDAGNVPFHIGVEMLATVRTIIDNVIKGADKEVDKTVTTNIVETLPWVNYEVVFREIEERGEAKGRAEGEAKGRVEGEAIGEVKGMAKRDMELAVKVFESNKNGVNMSALSQRMREWGISDETIEAARRQYEAERSRQSKNRAERER